ncbi:MAG: heparan-alpha-glucosaminide N-acetyltransferase [Rhodospirillaceae bacterium]
MTDAPSPAHRIAAVDVARGAALVAMVLYHGCWDLTYAGLARFDLFGDLLWLAARDIILGAFLVLAGAGLTLAARGSVGWRRAASRIAVIAAAALAVTVASGWFAPDAVIFFGVLHHIALASLLGLGFLRLPGGVVLAAAAACLVAPGVLAGPAFDSEWLSWLGLMSHEPRSNDYVPLLPWFALVLTGMVAARRLEALPVLAGWVPRAAALRGLARAGRYSLAVYLVHQPLLLGAVWLVAAALGGGTAGGAATTPAHFMGECRAACERTGASAPSCVAHCRCVDAGFAERGLWPLFLKQRLDDDGQRLVAEVVQSCVARGAGR